MEDGASVTRVQVMVTSVSLGWEWCRDGGVRDVDPSSKSSTCTPTQSRFVLTSHRGVYWCGKVRDRFVSKRTCKCRLDRGLRLGTGPWIPEG